MPKKAKPTDVNKIYDFLGPIVNRPRAELEQRVVDGERAGRKQSILEREIRGLESEDDESRFSYETRNEIRALRDEINDLDPTYRDGVAAQAQLNAIQNFNKKHHEITVGPKIRELVSRRDALENAIAALESRMDNCEFSMENRGYSDQARDDCAHELDGLGAQYSDMQRELMRIEDALQELKQTTK